MTVVNLVTALNTGLRRSLERDARVVILGEDVGRLGGVFRVTEALQKDFGENRVMDMPLAESGIVGTAFGLALRGYRPVCEIQFDGFVYPAMDQIIAQVAKIHYRTAGRVRVPITIRIPSGGGIGAVEHHSESPETYFAHTAGLRVVYPSNPADGFHMIGQSVDCDDPVIFLEPKRRYWDNADVDMSAEPPLPLHNARVVRAGTDATVVTYGSMVATALEAADIAETEGHHLEVVDLRSLSPIDFGTVEQSVQHTRRLVVVHEAPMFLGMGAEIAAHIAETCFYDLAAPVLRVTGFDIPYPPAKLELFHLPDPDRILDSLDRVLAP